VRSDGKQHPITLKEGKTLLGRQEDCPIKIPSAQISRHHCEITAGGSGIRIRDLGSSNGTFVNGQRVEEAPLHEGDVLAIGPMLFVMQIDGQPAQIDPEALSQRVRSASASAAAKHKPAPPSTDSSAPNDASGSSGSSFFSVNDDSSIDTDFDFDFADDDDDDQPDL